MQICQAPGGVACCCYGRSTALTRSSRFALFALWLSSNSPSLKKPLASTSRS
ncbi:hypothetical protein T11_11899 [Trichinella zimbabwensis]|uniref:Uncharacterized protein n=1 Tax=Trichinella zimbabwensis TaxID=268475 RepID=A0A0V1DRF5_9BILA|nr:hypothetical protein T11_11899 [Trichinella zimbabwensis]